MDGNGVNGTAAGRKGRLRRRVAVLAAAAALVLPVAFASRNHEVHYGPIPVRPSLEHRTAGGLYSPSTLSLLRTHSWLEGVRTLELGVAKDHGMTVEFVRPGSDRYLSVHNLPADELVPRLHYRPAAPPDAFEAFNLMMAEYSRNSLSVPQGAPGDSLAHYRTNLTGKVPWELAGDYQFVPNADYRPLRVSVVNNCLRPGLWELSANDRSGEIYHAWFDLPLDFYHPLTARVNGLAEAFVRKSLGWSEAPAPLALERLQEELRGLGRVDVRVRDDEVGFSSQGSRRKISREFALYEADGALRPPRRLGDLLRHPVLMTSFVEPGIYSSHVAERTRFDFGFLGRPQGATLALVRPKTRYDGFARKAPRAADDGDPYVSLAIHLADGLELLVGNLPLRLLVQQEDFVLHGFGVGILDAEGLAERRRFLIDAGPAPSYAYLARREGGGLVALNSHKRGLEQVFLRSHPNAAEPFWEITLTSYERIIDIVRYEVPIPAELREAQRRHSAAYVPPLYFSYRDDNIN